MLGATHTILRHTGKHSSKNTTSSLGPKEQDNGKPLIRLKFQRSTVNFRNRKSLLPSMSSRRYLRGFGAAAVGQRRPERWFPGALDVPDTLPSRYLEFHYAPSDSVPLFLVFLSMYRMSALSSYPSVSFHNLFFTFRSMYRITPVIYLTASSHDFFLFFYEVRLELFHSFCLSTP